MLFNCADSPTENRPPKLLQRYTHYFEIISELV